MSKLSTDEENTQMGQRLLKIRSAHRLSQIEFAARLGLTSRAYGNYERGEREMPTSLFRSLLEHFRIDPVWLLSSQDDQPIGYSGTSAIDQSLFQSLIEMVEAWSLNNNKVLRADKKARIISLAYNYCKEAGVVDVGYVSEMLSLAA
jgi:transcriptional regulator with XRE-family HTH domain